MSYQIAYTTQFHSLENVLWKIEIYINDYVGRPVEIKLDGDEPCVIEWPETDKMDVVQSSTCTLRVSNESDRQMVQLLNNIDAGCLVWRDGKPYWAGHLDDSIYEEPYSFKTGYVTEITFSDFGILNRRPFTMTGKHSVWDILLDVLAPTGFGNGSVGYAHSLLNPSTHQPINLYNLYLNADRFKEDSKSFGEMTTKREVLEDILRPLGLRIMQKNYMARIYDIEYLRDHQELQKEVVWKGTDATLKGSETFGWYEVAFEPDAHETLADGEIDYDNIPWGEDERFFTSCYDESQFTQLNMGYYIQAGKYIGPERPVDISPDAKFFRTRPILTDGVNTGVGWRIKCYTIDHYVGNAQILGERNLVRGNVAGSIGETESVLSIETGYLPVVPERDKYQLRVNLDFILSFRPNPFDNPPDEWVTQQSWYISYEKEWRELNTFAIMVPVKLELLNDSGTAIYHYKNADSEDVLVPKTIAQYLGKVTPLGIGDGKWVPGAASSYADMFLAYYKDYKSDDNDRDPLVTKGGWSTNRIALAKKMEISGSLYRVRDDGEYLPLPPAAGRLRLTVGNGVFLCDFRLSWHVTFLLTAFSQQMYRNPKITLVRDKRREDGINTDPVYEQDVVNEYADCLSETVNVGTWQKGIAPSARGLLFDSQGNVFEKFEKQGKARTLADHRRHCLIDQKLTSLPVLSGTAELDYQFHALLDHSTPGVFVVTGLRQNLHQDTEEVTMARIANVGLYDYEFEWSDPYCVEEEEPYKYTWSSPVCVQEPGPYKFAWGNGICVKQYIYTLEWEEMQTYD